MEAAEGTFEPLVHEALNKATANGESRSTADITVRTQDGVHSATAAGNGPFNAVHLCLRTCPSSVYPQMADLRLTDYKVHVLEPRKGAAAKVCVLIEWSDHRKSWSTVGVSHNVTVARLERVSGCYPVRANAPHRKGRFHRESRRRLLLGRLSR